MRIIKNVLVNITIMKEINISDSLRTIVVREKENIYRLMEVNISENGLRIKEKVTVSS